MKKYKTIIPHALLFILIISSPIFAADSENGWGWHTRPDKWKEPRIWHRGFEYEKDALKDIDNWLIISHEKLSEKFKHKELSTNKVYWYGFNPDEIPKDEKHKFHVFTTEFPIYVFNERGYLIKLLLKEHYPNYLVTIYWINGKLLYIENWWGRVLGAYYIFDVEKESVIYKELVNDGYLPYIQWKKGKQ